MAHADVVQFAAKMKIAMGMMSEVCGEFVARSSGVGLVPDGPSLSHVGLDEKLNVVNGVGESVVVVEDGIAACSQLSGSRVGSDVDVVSSGVKEESFVDDDDGGGSGGSLVGSVVEAKVDSLGHVALTSDGGACDDGTSSSFFKDHVKTPAIKEFDRFLRGHGVKVSKTYAEELALVSYTGGTVPDAFVAGRRRLRVLALIGDRVLYLAMAEDMYEKGFDTADVQGAYSRLLTRVALSPVCGRSGLGRHIRIPSGVDLEKTAVGGEALEAVAGVVFRSQGMQGVRNFMIAMQLL